MTHDCELQAQPCISPILCVGAPIHFQTVTIEGLPPLLQDQGLLAFIAGLRATTRDDLPAAPDSLEKLVLEKRWGDVQKQLNDYLTELSRCSKERSTSGRMASEWGRCIAYAKLASRGCDALAAELSPELFMRFVTSMICGRPAPDLEIDCYGGLEKAGIQLVLKLGEVKSTSDGAGPCLCRAARVASAQIKTVRSRQDGTRRLTS